MKIISKILAPIILICLFLISVGTVLASDFQVKELKTPNGIKLWFMEEKSLPIISVSLVSRGGSSLDPDGKEGLGTMVSSLIDEGAGELNSYEFQKKLLDLSISLGFDVDRDSFSGSLKTLRHNYKEAFRLLGLSLTKPRFDDEPVSRIKNQLITNLKMDAANPNRIASKLWFKKAFLNHQYAKSPHGNSETIKNISANDMKDFVSQRFCLDNLIISVVGDISESELLNTIDENLSKIPNCNFNYTLKDVQSLDSGIYFKQEPLPQSTIFFGQRGVKRNDPDYFGLRILNYIIGGGGFVSRLTKEIREKEGLAYSIYSYLLPLRNVGIIYGGVSTRNNRVGEVIERIKLEWKKFSQGKISESEIRQAKDFIIGSFPLNLTSRDQISSLLTSIQYHELGINYLKHRDRMINAFTTQDLKRIAKKIYKSDNLLFVVVGDPEDSDKRISLLKY